LRLPGGAGKMGRTVEGESSVSERSQDKKPPSDYLGAFGFVVLILTIIYAVWTAT
jgi:hypothetical protein